MVDNGYGRKVEVKRRKGPPVLIFVKETPEQMTEENLDRISMNRTRYEALFSIRNAAEVELQELESDVTDKILPKNVVSCTK